MDCGTSSPSSLLAGFKLVRSGSNLFYNYTCQELRGVYNATAGATAASSSGSIVTLELHPVVCSAGSALRRFQLTRPTGSTMNYNFTCATVPGLGTCTNRTTSPGKSWVSTDAAYLERIPFACLEGEVLSSFGHQFTGSPSLMFMDYTCCAYQ